MPMPGNTVVTPLHLGVAYAIVFVVCLLAGRAQRREVGASRRRLVAVAAIMSLLILSPAIPALLFGEKLDMSLAGSKEAMLTHEEAAKLGIEIPPDAEPVTPGSTTYWVPMPLTEEDTTFGTGYLPRPVPMPVSLLAVLLGLLFTLHLGVQALRPVHRALRERFQLPEVTKPETLASVGALAERMAIPMPRVLRLASTSGVLMMQAVTGGTLAPVLIATDGVLTRMHEDETSAILAHELGHVARRSVGWSVLIMILVQVMTVLVSAFLFISVSLALGYAVLWGSRKIFSQFDERACDLRAARAVGFLAMARALDMVHAANSLSCGPLLQRLFYATQTHPSRAVRLEHLALHAPPEERDLLGVDAAEAARQHRTTRAVLLLFVLILAFGVCAGFDENLKWYGISALVVTVLTPFVLKVLAVFRRRYYAWRIGYLRLAWGKAERFLLLASCFVMAVVGIGAPWSWPTWPALLLGCLTIWWTLRSRKLNAQVRHAIREQDFQKALSLYDRAPPGIRNRSPHRYLQAMLLAADRDDGAALQRLEALARDKPRYWVGQLLRCLVTSWHDPKKALAIADRVAAAVPHNPHVLAQQAAILGRLSRFDEARAKIAEAIDLQPEAGSLWGIHAAIEIEAGELEKAEQLIAEAEQRGPGATALFLLKADLLVSRGDLEAAAEVVKEAEEAVESNRMSLLMHRMDLLKARYEKAVAGTQA